MIKLVAIIVLGTCFFLAARTSAIPESPRSPQRFVPIGLAENDRQGIPWHAFFALDTQTGQLCRTSNWQLKDTYAALPTCVSLLR
jgi:hypothetical protein